MKKFVGLVNGQTFDNEKDWTKAAQEAIEKNDGNLAISSYYKYTSDDAEKVEDKKEDDKFVSTNEYFLGDRKPDKVDLIKSTWIGQPGYTNREYNVTPALEERLKVASNKAGIKESIEYHVKKLVDNIKKYRSEVDDIEKRLNDLQKELHEQTDQLLDQEARRKYYNTLLDIIETSEIEPENQCEVDECDESCTGKCDKNKKVYTAPEVKETNNIKTLLDIDENTSLFDVLRKLGILK